MHANNLKSIVGSFMVVAHFSAMALVLFLGKDYLTYDQCLDIILILAPLFSAFTLAVVSDFIRHRHVIAKGKKVNKRFIFIALFIPLIYTISLFTLILAWPFEWINDITRFRRSISVCETVIGGAVGLIMGTLFDFRKFNERS